MSLWIVFVKVKPEEGGGPAMVVAVVDVFCGMDWGYVIDEDVVLSQRK